MDTKQNEVTIKNLLEAGAHFGHQTRRWNPKMKRFIFEERNGLYIIDLAKTLQQIREAVEIVKKTIIDHKSVLFVGTKKQAKTIVRELAEECGEYFVCERWLGGMLTNLATIRKSVKKLDRIEKRISSDSEGLKKKEISMMTKDQLKLEKNLAGVRAMRKVPGLVVVVDPGKEHIAVKEANKLGIPVIGLVDTNCDPDPIQHVIACNDDALKSIKLIIKALTDSIIIKKNEIRFVEKKDKLEKEKEDVKDAKNEGIEIEISLKKSDKKKDSKSEKETIKEEK